jgi:hypothetical protein
MCCRERGAVEFSSLATMRVGVSAIIMDELSSLIGNVRSDFGNPFQIVNDLTCGLKESVASIVWQ